MFKDYLDVFSVLKKQRWINQNIINIYGYKYIKELLKRIINILLKCTRTVLYTK